MRFSAGSEKGKGKKTEVRRNRRISRDTPAKRYEIAMRAILSYRHGAISIVPVNNFDIRDKNLYREHINLYVRYDKLLRAGRRGIRGNILRV